MPTPYRLKNGNWIDLEQIARIAVRHATPIDVLYHVDIEMKSGSVESILFDPPPIDRKMGGSSAEIRSANEGNAETYRDELAAAWVKACDAARRPAPGPPPPPGEPVRFLGGTSGIVKCGKCGEASTTAIVGSVHDHTASGRYCGGVFARA